MESGVDELLFNLIILRSIVNSEGLVWQAQPTQYYIIECMPRMRKVNPLSSVTFTCFTVIFSSSESMISVTAQKLLWFCWQVVIPLLACGHAVTDRWLFHCGKVIILSQNRWSCHCRQVMMSIQTCDHAIVDHVTQSGGFVIADRWSCHCRQVILSIRTCDHVITDRWSCHYGQVIVS